MPEYAVLVAVVLTLGLVGYQFLVEDARRTMGQVGSALNGVEVSRTGVSTNVDATQRVALGHKVNWTWPAAAIVIVTSALLVSRRRNGSKKNGVCRARETEVDVEPTHIFDKRQRILHVLSNDLSALLEGRLAVRHVMTKDLVTIRPHQSVKAALALMEETRANYLFVCDRNGTLVGLLSRYFLQRAGGKKVANVMVTDPPFVTSTALLNPTITQMVNRGVSCVAILDDDQKVSGMLTTIDVQLTLKCPTQ